MSRLIPHRAEHQQAVIDELYAIAKRLDQLMLFDGCFSKDDDYLSGQCNSCLIVAHQQLETVVATIRDCGEEGVSEPPKDLVLQIVERRRKPSGKRGLEAAPKAKNGVVRARKRSGARVVAGGSR